jgi:SPP1 gp7 family putative phage head morphogenesis protein
VGDGIIRESLSGDVDPAGADKDRLEQQIVNTLMQYWQGQRGRIMDRIRPKVPKGRKLTELPDLLNATWWDKEIKELLAVLTPLISKGASGGVAVHAAELEPLGIAVDWTLPHADAMDWARKYSGNLVKGITKTTKAKLRNDILDWMDSGEHLDSLSRTLTQGYGYSRKRAELIAMTETTKAFSRGQIVAAQELERTGRLEYDKQWLTANDDIVCDICKPLNEKRVRGTQTPFHSEIAGELYAPPAHPGCRCGVATRPVVPE